MPLRPLGKKVTGVLIKGASENEAIIDPFADSRKKQFVMKVLEIGIDCEEVQPGDVVILPDSGWVNVTLLEDGEAVERIAIPEYLLLAVVE